MRPAVQHPLKARDQRYPGAIAPPPEGFVHPIALHSWKEIAAELKRGIRTVQRWEGELHLPVRRLGRGSRSPVFAYKGELQEWLRTSIQERATKVPAGSHRQQKLETQKFKITKTESNAVLIQAIEGLFANARHSKQQCGECGSVMQFLEMHLWIQDSTRKWKASLPLCPMCDAESLKGLRQSRQIQ